MTNYSKNNKATILQEIDPMQFMQSNGNISLQEAIMLCASHMAGFAAQRGSMWGISVDHDGDALMYQRCKRLMERLCAFTDQGKAGAEKG